MRTRAVLMGGLAVAVVCGAGCGAPTRGTPKNDQDLFQGAWRVEKVEKKGQEVSDDRKFVFTGDRFCFRVQDEAGKEVDQEATTFAINPGSTPKTLDLGTKEGRTLCIYA